MRRRLYSFQFFIRRGDSEPHPGGTVTRPRQVGLFGKTACRAGSALAILWMALTLTAPRSAEAAGEVGWSATPDRADVRAGETVFIRVHADIQPTWHIYSTTTPPGGPKIGRASCRER